MSKSSISPTKRAFQFALVDIGILMVIGALVVALAIERWENNTVDLDSLGAKPFKSIPSLSSKVITRPGRFTYGENLDEVILSAIGARQDLNTVMTVDNPRNWELDRVTLVLADLRAVDPAFGAHTYVGVAEYSGTHQDNNGLSDHELSLLLIGGPKAGIIVDPPNGEIPKYIGPLKRLYKSRSNIPPAHSN